MSETVARPYIVVLGADKAGSPLTEHRVDCDAYTASEAVFQAVMEVEAKWWLTSQGYRVRVLSVSPDTAVAAARIQSLIDEVKLAMAPLKSALA